jgi:hypothetical protein
MKKTRWCAVYPRRAKVEFIASPSGALTWTHDPTEIFRIGAIAIDAESFSKHRNEISEQLQHGDW